jgi:hypothetical protein
MKLKGRRKEKRKKIRIIKGRRKTRRDGRKNGKAKDKPRNELIKFEIAQPV